MSTLAIVLIVLAAVLVLFFVAGFVVATRRRAADEADMRRTLARADRALEAARAADRGWDRELLHAAARDALARERPGFEAASLDLVLVEDRPGVEQDRAHMLASGHGGPVRVVLARDASGAWALERLS
jgi:hypothetical protein